MYYRQIFDGVGPVLLRGVDGDVKSWEVSGRLGGTAHGNRLKSKSCAVHIVGPLPQCFAILKKKNQYWYSQSESCLLKCQLRKISYGLLITFSPFHSGL